MLNNTDKYKRIGNVLYENDIPVLKFLQEFRDCDDQPIEYTNRYIEQNPHLIETILMKKPNVVKFFYDLETTGLDYTKHGIQQIAGAIEVNGEIDFQFDWTLRPFTGKEINAEALGVTGKTEEQIRAYEDPKKVYARLMRQLSRYVDRYARTEKIHLIGFNNARFDNDFLRQFFMDNDDMYFGSWFFADSPDVMCLASQYLIDRRWQMPNFKLATVAKELGIDVDSAELHDAQYDIYLTLRIVTGKQIGRAHV